MMMDKDQQFFYTSHRFSTYQDNIVASKIPIKRNFYASLGSYIHLVQKPWLPSNFALEIKTKFIKFNGKK